MKMYGERSNGKHHGVVLTKASVVEKMLDLVDYVPEKDLRKLRVIEPSAGEGVFTLAIIKRLYKSAIDFGFDFQHALENLEFYDIDKASMEILKTRVSSLIRELGGIPIDSLFKQGDFLLMEPQSCDLIIGNPPYVRHENIPDDQKEIYKTKYRTFTHRSDLYIPFYEKGLSLLKPNGCLSFICSNRWLKNQYGKNLRELISAQYRIQEIIDLEEVDAFEESVIAYPAITNIVNSRNKATAPYFQLSDLSSFIHFSQESQPQRELNQATTNWFARKYEHGNIRLKLASIAEQGFSIGIGVATGRDKIFIRKDFNKLVEQQVLLPILTSKGVKGDQISWQGNYLINPYEADGKLIDLDHYPKAKAYFEANREALSSRHIAKKNPENWFRTIDRVHFGLRETPKIILPDITGNKFLHIDKGEFYPHHNLYYISGKSLEELELLAAILLSDFVKKQLLEVGNKMNGGYPRWQSQNIKKLKLPILSSIPQTTSSQLIHAYKEKDFALINKLITVENISTFEVEEGQLVLFEP